MAHHETNLAVDDAVRRDRALLGLAAVVDHHRFKLLAVDAARGIDAFNSGVHTFADHVAILGNRARRGADHTDLDGLRVGSRGKRQAGGNAKRRNDRGQTKCWLHEWTPLIACNRWFSYRADAGSTYDHAPLRCFCTASIHRKNGGFGAHPARLPALPRAAGATSPSASRYIPRGICNRRFIRLSY
ncbi:hypothetical protein D3C86_785030 [compost metagenome]